MSISPDPSGSHVHPHTFLDCRNVSPLEARLQDLPLRLLRCEVVIPDGARHAIVTFRCLSDIGAKQGQTVGNSIRYGYAAERDPKGRPADREFQTWSYHEDALMEALGRTDYLLLRELFKDRKLEECKFARNSAGVLYILRGGSRPRTRLYEILTPQQ